MSRPQLFSSRRLVLFLSLLLAAGFIAVSLSGFLVSRQAIRDAIIGQDLPLTSKNIGYPD